MILSIRTIEKSKKGNEKVKATLFLLLVKGDTMERVNVGRVEGFPCCVLVSFCEWNAGRWPNQSHLPSLFRNLLHALPGLPQLRAWSRW